MELNVQVFVSFLLCGIINQYANGYSIQLFRDYNYTGLILESNFQEQCVNLHENVASFSSDSCTVHYWDPDCKSPTSWKKPPGNHRCNGENGGSQLNVYITKYYEENQPGIVPDVLESYRPVCTCINIPNYILKWTSGLLATTPMIFLLTLKQTVHKKNLVPHFFPAGQYPDIRNVYSRTATDSESKIQYKVQSFGPDKYSEYFKKSCQLYILLSQLTTKVAVLEQNLRESGTKFDLNQKEIFEVKNARITENAEVSEKLMSMELKIQNVEKSMEDKSKKFKGLEDDSSNIRAKIINLEEQNQVISRKIGTIETNVKTSNFKIKDIEDQRNTCKTEFKNFSTKIKHDLHDLHDLFAYTQ